MIKNKYQQLLLHEIFGGITTIGDIQSLPPSVKRQKQADNLLLKDKLNNEKPTHKTAHLQAPTHKPILQLAKELFSCQCSTIHHFIYESKVLIITIKRL